MPPTRAAYVTQERYMDRMLDPVFTSSEVPRSLYRTSGPANVTGGSRHLFQRAPVVPQLTSVAPNVLMATEAPPPEEAVRPPTPPVKEVGTQSDFRESEAQTDPYTPDYVVQPGSNPELLTLASLAWGQGLPATMAEVDLIERARARRRFETELPDISEDPKKWRAMMEEQQMRELKEREDNIQKLQEQRLELLREAMYKREQENEFVSLKRLESLKERWATKLERNHESMRRLRVKQIRKLSKARTMVGIDVIKPRNIIEDYSNPVSEIYAPLQRGGRRIDRDAVKFETSYLDRMNLDGVRALESSLPRSMFEVKIQKPTLSRHKSSLETRKASQMEADLNKVEEMIAMSRDKSKQVDSFDDLAAYRKAPIVVRPKTPVLAGDARTESQDEASSAAIFMQKLLRGRAAQLAMLAGKERRLQLIKEVRTAEMMPSEEELRAEGDRKDAELHADMLRQGMLKDAVGTEVGRMLDYLHKELVRHKEERRLAALAMMAERQRRLREAEEAGRRDAELRQRDQQDEVFRQVMQVHNGTVDSYLENVVADTVGHDARVEALREAQVKVAAVNNIVDSLEAEGNKPEAIATDLVRSFLLPHVAREEVHAKIRADQRKLVNAAASEAVPAAKQAAAAKPGSST